MNKKIKKGLVAIVGATNVGKSTLFNRLTTSRTAIVDGQAGTTRDKNSQLVVLDDFAFTLLDTGGFSKDKKLLFADDINTSVETAIKESELILFVVDSKCGISKEDDALVPFLRKHQDKVVVVANKSETMLDNQQSFDFVKLGFGKPIPISALHGTGLKSLKEIIRTKVSSQKSKTDKIDIKIAIAGRPNVGKSSILNRLTKKNISIVSEIPQTTRDTVSTAITYKKQRFLFLDTAGLRRKSKTKYGVDYFATSRSVQAIKNADILLLILDASEKFANQDQKIVSLAVRWHKVVLVVVNKWDLIEKTSKSVNMFKKEFYNFFPFLRDVPVMFVSAITGQRIHNILDVVSRTFEKANFRVPTSVLNQFVQRITRENPPQLTTGKVVKIYYATQVSTSPCEFVFFCNRPELVQKNWRNYLQNRIKKEFDLSASFLKLTFKKGDGA